MPTKMRVPAMMRKTEMDGEGKEGKGGGGGNGKCGWSVQIR